MIKYLLILALPYTLLAQDDNIRIRALYGESLEGSLHLFGDVFIENNSMKSHSEEAFIDNDNTEVQLKDQVVIRRATGEKIECQEALLNIPSKQGRFKKQVSLQDSDSGLILRCQDLNVQLEDADEPFLKELIAVDDVFIDYSGELTASGDYAKYEFDANLKASYPGSLFPGSVFLKPIEGGLCTVKTPSQDVIHAREFRMNVPSKTIHCDKAHGSIFDQKRKEPLNFWARRVFWDQVEHYLVLTEDVTLEHDRLGLLHSDREIQVKQRIVGEKKILSEITCLGATRMRSIEPETGWERRLHCFKSLYIDNEKGTCTLESPEINGHTPFRKQVHYKDRVGEITANHVHLSYNRSEKGMRLEKVVMTGQVQMENYAAPDPKNSDPVHQFALADMVELYPMEGRMEMHAHEGGSVIFYDKIKEVQISAPAVIGMRDGINGEESLRGLGNVRMTLAQEEVDLLKSRFQGIQ